jgi:hypothetical protein
VLVVAVGSGGDIAPLAAAAGRLAARGLKTTLMAPRRYAALARAEVDFRPAGADDVFESVFSGPAEWTARHGLAESSRYYGAAAPTTLQQIRRGWVPRIASTGALPTLHGPRGAQPETEVEEDRLRRSSQRVSEVTDWDSTATSSD